MKNILLKELGRRQVATSADLQSAMGISQPTLSRLISKNADQVLSIGHARSARYALRRNLREMGAEFSVFAVNESGRLLEVGVLTCLEGGRWHAYDPISKSDRLFDGIPYFLADLQPQGFMGRAFSKRHHDLGLPARLSDWSDDDVMSAIIRGGKNAMGNLLVGEQSIKDYLSDLLLTADIIPEDACALTYAMLANNALQGDPAGSSAGGEQPKFACAVKDGETSCRHVLVKFSPSDSSDVSQRWRDLLVAEHMANVALRQGGAIKVTGSRLIESDNRIFLEVVRFDRVGDRGRVGVLSLGALDDEHYGRRDNWMAAADRIERDNLLTHQDAESMRVLYIFGGLIANTDKHFGNISFLVGNDGSLSLSPSYDQLPMLYAPTGGQIVDRTYSVDAPVPNTFNAWRVALPMALNFWGLVADSDLISPQFKAIAASNLETLTNQSKLMMDSIPDRENPRPRLK